MKKTNIKKITFLLASILTINSIIPGNYVMATENKINNINIESESSVDTDSNLDESSSNVEEINIKDIEKDTEQFETESSDETKNVESSTTEETTEEFETEIKNDDESKFYSDKTEITEEETDENTTVSKQDNNEEEYLITFYILDKNGIDYKEYQQIKTENKKIKFYPDCPEIEGAKFKEWRLIEDDTDYDLPEEYEKDCDIYAMYDFDIETQNTEGEYTITFWTLNDEKTDYIIYDQIETVNQKLKSIPSYPTIDGSKTYGWSSKSNKSYNSSYAPSTSKIYTADTDYYAVYSSCPVFLYRNDYFKGRTVYSSDTNTTTLYITEYGPRYKGTFQNIPVGVTTQNITKIVFEDNIEEVPSFFSSFFKKFTSNREIVIELNNVKTIKSSGFESMDIKEIDLSHVEQIEANAFRYTALFRTGNITTLDLSNAISIGENAFAQNTSSLSQIEKLIFSASLKTIGTHAFENTKTLKYIENWDEIQEINDYSFFNCTALINIPNFPKTLNTIGNSAFHNCNSLKGTLDFSYVLSIGKNSFTNCESIENIIITNNTTSIGASAFDGCLKLNGIIDLSGVTKINNAIFNNCTSIDTEIIFSNKISEIGSYAFKNCKNMRGTIDFSNVTRVGSSAFQNCKNFTGSANLINCSFIGNEAFYECTKMNKIVLSDSIPRIYSDTFYKFGYDYNHTTPNTMYDLDLKNVTIVDARAFSYTSIKSVTGNTVEKIGQDAFSYCEHLHKIVFPQESLTLGNNVFKIDQTTCHKYGWTSLISNSSSLDETYLNKNFRTSNYDIFESASLEYCGSPIQLDTYVPVDDFNITIKYKRGENSNSVQEVKSLSSEISNFDFYFDADDFYIDTTDQKILVTISNHGETYGTYGMDYYDDYFNKNPDVTVSVTVPVEQNISRELIRIEAEYIGPNIYVGKQANKYDVSVTAIYLVTSANGSQTEEEEYVSVRDCIITLPVTVKGRNTIPVEYQGKTAECYYTGIEPTETKRELLKIKATYNGPKIYVDKYVNKKDISVIGTYRITYSDGSLKEKDEPISIDDCTVSLPKTVKGQNTIPVSYQNKDTTCNYEGIEIVEINRELIKISAIYTGPDIYEHKYADKNNITVTGTYRIMYSDNTINTIETNILVNDCTITLPKTIKGSNTIPVEYHGKETSCTYKGIGLSIVKKELESIKVTYNGPDVWEGEKPIEQDFSVIGIYNITMNDGTSYKQNESIKFTDCTYTIPFAVIGTNRFPVIYESKQDDAIFNGKEIKIIETKLAKLDSIYTGPDIYVDNKPDRKDITIIAYYKETKNNGDIETIQKNIDIDDCKYTIPVAIKGENIIPIEYDGMNSECTFHGIIAAEISRILDSISAKYTGNTIIIGNKADINDFIVYANYIVKYADNHIETIQKRIESKNCVFTDLTATKTPETTANIQFTDMEVTKETNCNYPTKEKGKGQETKPSPDPEPTPSPTPVPKPDPIPVPEPIPEPVPIPTPSPDPIPIPVTPIVPPEPVKNIGSNEQIKEVPISDIQVTKVLPYMPDSIKDEELEQEPKPEITHVQEKHEQTVEYHCIHPLIIICLMIIFILFVLVYIIVKHIIEKDDNENKDTTR